MSKASQNIVKVVLTVSAVTILFLVFRSCSPQEETATEKATQRTVDPLVIYITDSKHSLSDLYAVHVAKSLEYTKIPYGQTTVKSFNESPVIGNRVKSILTNGTENMNEAAKERLLKFVAEGGTLIFTSANEDPTAGYLSGLRPEAEFNYDLESAGLKFVKNMLPNIGGASIYSSKRNVGLHKDNFKSSVNILATSATDETQPTILEHQIGNGRVVHFNTSILFAKEDRGLLFASVLKGLQGVPYPIANVSTIFIDDFPNPLYDISSEPIKSEMGLTQAQFVTDIWWPDMLKLGSRLNLTYSAYPCFNYDQIKEPPFLFKEWDMHKSIRNKKEVITTNWMMQEVLDNGLEMAFHGYNHESFLHDVWSNPDNIEGSLAALRKKWKVNGFGAFPKSYVAPSNDIDSIGLVHLANAMPEIEFMSTTYSGELSEGGFREFDYDPFEPRLFDFPRITSGYVFTDILKYTHQSTFLYTGIWTHFVHPDDVFQLPDVSNTSAGNYVFRNQLELGWRKTGEAGKGMYDFWEAYLEEVIQKQPSTRFMTVSDGATITRDWRQSEYEFTKVNDFYNVTKVSKNKWSNRNFYWSIFSEKRNELRMEQQFEKLGVTFSKIRFYEGSLYTVKTKEPTLIFDKDAKLKGEPPFFPSEVYAAVKEDFDDYARERQDILFGTDEELTVEPSETIEVEEVIQDSVAWLVGNERLKEATNMLAKQLIKADASDSSTFNLFVKYLGYQDALNTVWPFLDKVYLEKSRDISFDYLDSYLRAESYPSDDLQDLWIVRRIGHVENKLTLVKSYMSSYAVSNPEKLKQILLDLNKQQPSEEAYLLYIQFLIDNEPETVIKELEDKTPETHPSLCGLADTIAYLYADAKDIQRALLWADCASTIDMLTKLQWWADLEAFNKMQSVYEAYNASNPGDTSVMAFVSNTWYDIGEYERGALIANQLPESKTKESFRNRLNPDVVTFDVDVQKYLLVKTPELYHPDTMRSVKTSLRFTEHNSIELKSAYVVDNFDQSVLDNTLTYNLMTRNLRQHSLSIINSQVSNLRLNNFDVNNVSHTLTGIQYRYQTRENTTKPTAFGSVGLLQSDNGINYFTLGGGISSSNEKSFKSVSYNLSPVKTGPAISREIYFGELVGYYEKGFDKFLQTSASVVGTHYTNGVFEGALTGRLLFNLKREKKSRFSPYAEAFVSGSNANQEDGNPFWIIDGRFYGGGGLAWTYGKDQSRKLNARIEGGAFYDSYTNSFLRLNGNVAFPIKTFTYVTAQFEFFNQSLYYSNGFQIGIKHYFRRRREYFYKPRAYDEE